MEVAVISDTHLYSLTDDFVVKIESIAAKVDCFFHLGDSASRAVLDFLNGYRLYAVAGNMDPPEVAARERVKRIIELDGVRIGLIHGWGGPAGLEKRAAAEFSNDGVNAVCFGHSHRPFLESIGGMLVFNPGSAGAARGGVSTYGLISISGGKVEARHAEF